MATEMVGTHCKVTILGRAGIRYEEAGRAVHIDGEMLTGPHDFVVYVNSIQAWDTNEAVTDTERAQILANLDAIFRQHRLSVEFER